MVPLFLLDYYTVYSIYDSIGITNGVMSYIDNSLFNMTGNRAGMSMVKIDDTVGYNREGSRKTIGLEHITTRDM